MGELAERKTDFAAPSRSSVRRWHLTLGEGAVELEQVRHASPGQEWAPHWHEEWSLGAVVHGECRFSLDGQLHRARGGDILCIAPRAVHTGALGIEREPSGVLVFMFYVSAKGMTRLGLAPPAGCRLARSALLADDAKNLQDPNDVHAWLRRALAALASGQVLESSGALPAEAVSRVLSSFHACVVRGNALSIREIAEECAVGREHLHRILRRWVGMSPDEYRRALRINMAREMLMSGASVCQTALASGFADQAHFTRWFRRLMGYTPGDYLGAGRIEASSRARAPG